MAGGTARQVYVVNLRCIVSCSDFVLVNIDVDWMDPTFIRSLPFKPHDQTSNQLWQGIQLSHASNAELLKETAKELAGKGWLAVYTRMVSLRDFVCTIRGFANMFHDLQGAIMCKEVLGLIQGRVLVQTSPSQAYSVENTVAHALLCDEEFKQQGITRDHYCIKIPATGPGLLAMHRLVQEGIPILGTAVFSLEQAIACSQAGCLSISPYYNRTGISNNEVASVLTTLTDIASFKDPSLWPDVEDPAIQHPFSYRLYQMVHAFRQISQATGKAQPLIKLAA